MGTKKPSITTEYQLTVTINGTSHELTLAEAQTLYDLLGSQAGVRRHGGSTWPYYRWDRPYLYGGIGTAVNGPVNSVGATAINVIPKSEDV